MPSFILFTFVIVKHKLVTGQQSNWFLCLGGKLWDDKTIVSVPTSTWNEQANVVELIQKSCTDTLYVIFSWIQVNCLLGPLPSIYKLLSNQCSAPHTATVVAKQTQSSTICKNSCSWIWSHWRQSGVHCAPQPCRKYMLCALWPTTDHNWIPCCLAAILGWCMWCI